MYWLPTFGLIFVIFRIIADIIYRTFFIFPRTDLSGRFAAFTEENHQYRWIVPKILNPKEPVDVLIIGNSHVVDGVDPAIITKNTGLTAFNLAILGLPSLCPVQLLINHNVYPRIAIIDFSTRYSDYRYLHRIDNMADVAIKSNLVIKAYYGLADRLQWLIPSFFVPSQFKPVWWRGYTKLRHLSQTGRMSSGRYTPFQKQISFEWWFDKSTNHRITKLIRQKSELEGQYFDYQLRNMIDQTGEKCNIGSPEYNTSIEETETTIQTLLDNNVHVIFIRLPLHEDMIAHENSFFSQYFADIQLIASKFDIQYVDLNLPEHMEHFNKPLFYLDGMHMIDDSAKHITEYLSKLIGSSIQHDV